MSTLPKKKKNASSMRKRRGTRVTGKRVIKPIYASPRPKQGRRAAKNFSNVATEAIKKYGPAVATMAGGALTKALMNYIKGFGDYNVATNSIMGMEPPIIKNSRGSGSVIIEHREYISDVPASIDFTTHVYTINPGDDQTFPWLSQIAPSFEQYRLRGMVFYFNSLSSPNILSASATTGLGAVIMATQYDVEDPTFANKMEMENYNYANSRVPYKSFIHPVECARNQTTLSELYVRDHSVTDQDTDARFYDLGKFTIATTGMQADSGVVGELWVSYEIELFKPKITAEPSVETKLTDVYQADAFTNASPLGAMEKLEGSNLGTTYVESERRIYFPEATEENLLLLNFVWEGDSTATVAPGFAFNNCSLVNIFHGPINGKSNFGLTTTIVLYSVAVFQDSATDAYLTVGNNGTFPANGDGLTVIVTVLTDQLEAQFLKNYLPRHPIAPKDKCTWHENDDKYEDLPRVITVQSNPPCTPKTEKVPTVVRPQYMNKRTAARIVRNTAPNSK